MFERQATDTKKLLEDFARELLGKYFQVVRAKLAVRATHTHTHTHTYTNTHTRIRTLTRMHTNTPHT